MNSNMRGEGGGRWLKILGIVYLIRLVRRFRHR
jgi:hypothetical protein